MSFPVVCAVSGHGFGHFAQLAAVMNALHRLRPDLEILIVGAVPATLPAGRLSAPWRLARVELDVGLVMHDPLRVDVAATRQALQGLHARREAMIRREMTRLQQERPRFLLADIPYVSLQAARRCGVPAIALASLTWDQVCTAYFPAEDAQVQGWLEQMRSDYRCADLALLPEPALAGETFAHIQSIPPVASCGRCDREGLRKALGFADDDQRAVVLVSLGGIAQPRFPWHALIQDSRMHWLSDAPATPAAGTLRHLPQALPDWNFSDVLASVDAIVGKPGYGMVVEAAAAGIPYLYVRRGLFADEAPICDWLARHGRSQELSTTEFARGDWVEHLETLMARPAPARPQVNGAELAAQLLTRRYP